MEKKKIEPRQKEHQLEDIRNLGKQLGLKDMQGDVLDKF